MPKQTQDLSITLASTTLHMQMSSHSCQIQPAAKHTYMTVIGITVMFNWSKIHGISHTCALMLWICVTADLLSGREESH